MYIGHKEVKAKGNDSSMNFVICKDNYNKITKIFIKNKAYAKNFAANHTYMKCFYFQCVIFKILFFIKNKIHLL